MRSVTLEFVDGAEQWRVPADEIAQSLSGVVYFGGCLWVASDQTASVERLTPAGAAGELRYGDHHSYRLNDYVTLPQRDDTEVDIEGLDAQWIAPGVGYLWLVGSHSWARGQVKDKPTGKALEALRKVDLDANRCVLARIPVVTGDDGLPELVRSCPNPLDPDGRRLTAGMFADLVATLAGDDHLGPFVALPGKKAAAIPGKDNGLDVEGLAVAKDRLYVGLRGPVLRGWSVVLSLHVVRSGSLTTGVSLALDPANSAIIKHFLDLDGLGIRDLCVDGDDLIVLAGPTMVLDGPVRIFRWPAGATADAAVIVRTADLVPVHEVPYGHRRDHAEGFTRFGAPDGDAFLVVYDSPADSRRVGETGVRADMFDWQ